MLNDVDFIYKCNLIIMIKRDSSFIQADLKTYLTVLVVHVLYANTRLYLNITSLTRLLCITKAKPPYRCNTFVGLWMEKKRKKLLPSSSRDVNTTLDLSLSLSPHVIFFFYEYFLFIFSLYRKGTLHSFHQLKVKVWMCNVQEK